MSPPENLRVLITSHPLDGPGGIVNYVNTLIQCKPDDFSIDHFSVGRNPRQGGSLGNFLFPITDTLRLCRALRKRRPDCVHINTSFRRNALLRDGLLMLTLRVFRFRNVLLFFHGFDDELAHRVKKNRFLLKLFQMTFIPATIFVVLASSFRRLLTNLGVPDQSIKLLTTMFDEKHFDGVNRTRRLDDEIWLVFMSRIVREKGVFETMAAFSSVAEKFPSLRLIFAGDGPLRKELETRAAKLGLDSRIRFVGYVRDREKAQLLLNGDLFVFPTQSEGCPIVLLEAMAAGLPIISHRVGGIPDVFVDEENGILLDEISTASVTSALLRLLSDQNTALRIRRRNSEYAWARFGSQTVATRMYAAYRQLI